MTYLTIGTPSALRAILEEQENMTLANPKPQGGDEQATEKDANLLAGIAGMIKLSRELEST
jgi:hypothetical protein